MVPVLTRNTVLRPRSDWYGSCTWCASSLMSITAMNVFPVPVPKHTIVLRSRDASSISTFRTQISAVIWTSGVCVCNSDSFWAAGQPISCKTYLERDANSCILRGNNVWPKPGRASFGWLNKDLAERGCLELSLAGPMKMFCTRFKPQ